MMVGSSQQDFVDQWFNYWVAEALEGRELTLTAEANA